MKQPAHTIELEPWEAQTFGVRVVIEATSAMLWPLTIDTRLTVLITLMGDLIAEVAENTDQVDDIIDVLRKQMKTVLAPEQLH
jgi:hypothetical protein